MKEYQEYDWLEEDFEPMSKEGLEDMLDESSKKRVAVHLETNKTYTFIHREDLSSHQYTRKNVYKIKTDEQAYHIAKRVILMVLNKEKLISKGEYNIRYKKDPSWANAVRPYYIFDYDDDLDCFWYTEVYPYDD